MIPRAALDRRHLAAYALVLAAVAGAVLLSPGALLRSIRDLPDHVFLAALAGLYLARPFVGLPISPITVLVGFRYGVAGVIVALAGTALTCLPPYLAAGYLRGDGARVEEDGGGVGGDGAGIEENEAGGDGGDGPLGWLAARGSRAVDATGPLRGTAAARLSPAPADAVSYGAGLSGVPLRPYLLGTVLGEVPWALAFVIVGDSLSALSVEGVRASPTLLLGSTLLAALLLAYALRRSR